MKTAFEMEKSRRFAPFGDYVDYGHASPSRQVAWSNLDDDLCQEWTLLSWVPRAASHLVSRIFEGIPARQAAVSDRSRQTLAAVIEVIRSTRGGMRSLDLRSDGSIEVFLTATPAEELHLALSRDGRVSFICDRSSTKQEITELAKALLERLGSKEAGSAESYEDQKTSFATPQFEIEDNDLLHWDVDFTPPPPPSRALRLRFVHRGPAPLPDWGETDGE